MTRVVVVGIGGRMGEALLRLAPEEGVRIVAGVSRRGAPALAPELPVTASIAEALGHPADAVIDFSSPAACVEALREAVRRGLPFVSGTTGLGEAEFSALEEAARRIPVLHAPNMSVGIQLLLWLVEEAAKTLGPAFDVEITEVHHRHKKDAPSGTALRLAETVARALGRDLAQSARTGREGMAGPRTAEEIGILALRGGDVIGEHTVHFFGEGERIELTHRASNRGAFAAGALRAAKWSVGKPPGLYGMRDVL